MLHQVCKSGVCVNNIPGYTCYCSSGFIYHHTLLECVDVDECEQEDSCPGGLCVNTVGSYFCTCHPPLVLDHSQLRCVLPECAVRPFCVPPEEGVSLCWQQVSADLVCQSPLGRRQVSFQECCCLYGEGWGLQCALCPGTDTGRRPSSAEDCGILGGCENGRCIRVEEGYTCDCHHGYQLDMASMTCRDINECEEGGPASECVNARCVNTDGSYRCICWRGHRTRRDPWTRPNRTRDEWHP
uniref:Latent transforming growth factor beta binding protein 4 n=1 Tax=Gadus morhua TaxID=8049 RepID=A0A8C4YUN3_GADMO